jgi:hypothetical protein
MRYFIIFCLISAYLQGNAQRFCISAGYPGESSYSSDIKPWPEGGYIISGSTESGNGDVLLAKISESGQIIWQKTYGSKGLEAGTRIAAHQAGILALNRFQSDTNGNYGLWIFKTDSNGTIIWEKHVAEDPGELAEALVVLYNGDFVVASTTFQSPRQIYLRKFDLSGTMIWHRQLADSIDLKASDMLYAQNGRIYLAGEVQGTQSDLLLAAYNTAGEEVFRTVSGTPRNESCAGITEHTSGKLVVSATSFLENGIGQLYLQRFFPDGTEDERLAEANDVDKRIGRIVWNGSDRYLIPYSLLLAFGEKLTGYYEFDHWMTFLCHVKLEGQTSSVASAVVAGPDKSGVLTGYTENPNPSLPRIYVLKADSSCQTPTITLSTPELTPNLFSLYPNPASDQVVIRFEEAKKTKLLGVKLLDSSGRQWSPEFEKHADALTINLAGLPDGLYFTQITTDDTIFTQTLFKTQ